MKLANGGFQRYFVNTQVWIQLNMQDSINAVLYKKIGLAHLVMFPVWFIQEADINFASLKIQTSCCHFLLADQLGQVLFKFLSMTVK